MLGIPFPEHLHHSKQAEMEGKGTGVGAHGPTRQEARGEDFWIHFGSSQQLTKAKLQVTENFLPSLTVSQGIDKT